MVETLDKDIILLFEPVEKIWRVCNPVKKVTGGFFFYPFF